MIQELVPAFCCIHFEADRQLSAESFAATAKRQDCSTSGAILLCLLNVESCHSWAHFGTAGIRPILPSKHFNETAGAPVLAAKKPLIVSITTIAPSRPGLWRPPSPP